MKKNMLIRILSLVVVLACVFAFAGCYDDTEVKDSIAATQTSLEEAKKTLNDAIDAVKATADAAAAKSALDEAIATINAVKTTADAAATQAALTAAIETLENADKATNGALADAIADLEALQTSAATQAALEAAIKAAADANTSLETALNATITSNKTAIDAEIAKLTGDIDTVKNLITAVENGYVKTSDFEAAKKALEDADKAVEAKAVANAANIATINEALANVYTKAEADAKVADLEKKINDGIGANLTALQTKVETLETSVNGSIEAINKDIVALKAALGNIEGTEAGTLLERVVALESTVAAIDTDAFKKEYIAVTEILLGGEDEPKSFYNFLKIINDNIDFGGYDDESVLAYERRVEEIKFALSRAVTLEEIDKAFTDLADAEKGLVLLVDALAAKLDEITLINLGEDCTAKIDALKAIMEKIEKKNAKIENADDKIVVDADDKADYDLKTGAYDTLAGFAADKGAQVNGKIHPIFSVNKVLLASDATNIDGATTLIAGLVADVLGVDTIHVEGYFALYTNDVYEGLYNIALADAIAELVADKKEAYVNAGIATKADELKAAWIESEIDARIAADESLVPAEVRVTVEAEANAPEKLAEFAAAASTEVKATLEEEAEAKTEEYKAEVQADAEVIAKGVADKQAATKVADTLYNKAEYTAVNTRYELLKLAKEDAIAEGALLDQIKAIAGAWVTTRPAYDNSDKQNIAAVVALMNEWIADAKYQNDADFGTFTVCTEDLDADNVNYILGEDRLLTLAAADAYVKAMNTVYENNKVAELIENIKKAVNGNVDVDNESIDKCIAAIATLDADISDETNWTETQDGTKNKHLMVSAELRERLTIINKAYDDVLAAIEALKGTSITYDADTDTWTIHNYEAGKVIATYKNKLSVIDEDTKEVIGGIYFTVLADSSDDNKITSVTSTKGEEVLGTVQGLFEEFAQTAIEAYNNASKTIDKIDELVAKNGKLTLDLGDDIYEAINGINKALVAGAVYGMNLNYTFTIPVDDVMTEVQFRNLFDRLNAYGADYREMAESNGADKAEDVAADLTEAINNAITENCGAKLDNYNTIVNLYNRVVNEWVNVYFVNMTPAEAVAATDAVKKVVGGGTYAFITNDTFKLLNTEYELAKKTYTAAEKAASEWKTSANNAIASYTFHDWAKFQEIEEAYKALIAKYYDNFNDTTDPGFGLYATHTTFAAAYGECQRMADEAGAKITEIIDAIKALNALENITIGNYATVRTDIDDIKALISAFETGYCPDAQNDTDFIVDDVNYNVVLAKAEAMVKLYEVGVAAVGTTINNVEITTDYVEQQAGMLRMALQMTDNGIDMVDTVEKVNTVYGTYESYFVVA